MDAVNLLVTTSGSTISTMTVKRTANQVSARK